MIELLVAILVIAIIGGTYLQYQFNKSIVKCITILQEEVEDLQDSLWAELREAKK